MKLYRSGEKSRAICHVCEALTDTTFRYCDVPFSDGSGVASNVLAAVCDGCGNVVALPAQSTPAVKAARETAMKPIEVSLPAPFIEILDLAAFRIDPMATTEFRKKLLAYYIHRSAEDAKSIATLAGFIDSEELSVGSDVPRRRLSLKVTPRLFKEIEVITTTARRNRTDVIKGIVAQIHHDIVQPDVPRNLDELQRLAAVAAA